jgi:hypothetical protein
MRDGSGSTSPPTKVLLVLALIIVVWNLYTGATIQEIGLPGLFTVKFAQREDAASSPNMLDTRIPQKYNRTQSSDMSSHHDITSTWREIYPNRGSISNTIQHGDDFTFRIRAQTYSSFGRGSIKGLQIETSYQSTVPSSGSCTGRLSSDAEEMVLECTDSVSGEYMTKWVRE